MNATHFDVSLTITNPSVIGRGHRVTLETPETLTSARRVEPYVQDPPTVLDETTRPVSI